MPIIDGKSVIICALVSESRPDKKELTKFSFEPHEEKKVSVYLFTLKLCARRGGLFFCCLTVIRLFKESQSSESFMSFKIFLPHFHGNFLLSDRNAFTSEQATAKGRKKIGLISMLVVLDS